ncbi:MAG: hydroxyacylglutathione hydrolase [Candidatus Omnitrophota bacterium]|jgi:hydroxyacylglutathione hydrolase
MSESNLFLQQFEVGLMDNFVYFIGDKNTREVLVVDPAWEVDTILTKAKESDVKITGALITHHHYDHTNGVEELLKTHDIPVYINQADIPYLEFKNNNLKPVESAHKVQCGAIEIELIHTPGHTPGSQCFHVQDSLVSGDTLFINACGRCDFEGGSPEEMYLSLNKRLGRLSDNTILYPGHNYAATPTDTMGAQRQTNPYLLVDSLQNFLNMRG